VNGENETMRLTASGMMKTREESRKLSGFGQMWNPGDTVVVYYPLAYQEFEDEETHVITKSNKPDLLVAGCWGHQVDPKRLTGLKAIFVPTTAKVDESGNPVGTPDVTFQFSRISKSFIDGKKQTEIDKAMTKNYPSESMKQTELKAIESRYDTKSNMEAERPAVGKLTMLITTECVVVKLKADGTPDVDSARLVTQSLSNEKIRKLLNIMANANYKPNETETYLEVQYSFLAGVKKADAGKVDPTGIAPEYRVSYKYPEQFKSLESLLVSLPESSETIERRNLSYRKIEEKIILQALTAYAIRESEYLDAIKEETEVENLIKNAEVISMLTIKDSLHNEALRAKIDEALEEIRKNTSEEALPATESEEENPVDTEAPNIEKLLSNPNRASDDFANGVDLSSFNQD
jgi:hypothetical protein